MEISIDLSINQALNSRVHQIIRKFDGRPLVLRVFLESLASDHDGNGGFSDEVIGEGA